MGCDTVAALGRATVDGHTLFAHNSDRPLPFGVDTRVLERAGCDAAPIDPSTEDGRLTLLSYVWPDQVHRIFLIALLDKRLEFIEPDQVESSS